jgi:hypothetical protein
MPAARGVLRGDRLGRQDRLPGGRRRCRRRGRGRVRSREPQAGDMPHTSAAAVTVTPLPHNGRLLPLLGLVSEQDGFGRDVGQPPPRAARCTWVGGWGRQGQAFQSTMQLGLTRPHPAAFTQHPQTSDYVDYTAWASPMKVFCLLKFA